MSISDDVRGWLKFGGWVILVVVGAAVTWGTFREGTAGRVTANQKSIAVNEKTLGQHGVKIEKLSEHATRSETNMKWMLKTVEDYNVQQTAVLNAIEALKKP